MDSHEEIVYPKKGRGDPDIGPVAIMVAMEEDMTAIRRSMGIQGKAVCRIATSRLYRATRGDQDVSLVGPVLGAPHGVLVLEKLIILGAKRILFFGWCGSLQSVVRTGDFVVPDRGVAGEGTSAYYPLGGRADPKPSRGVFEAVVEVLGGHSIPFHKGSVWSTDAPYRETKDRVLSLQKQGVLAVDMELSALLTAAEFRGVEMGALLLVSDELSTLRWKPGFSTPRFKRSRRFAPQLIPHLCETLSLASKTGNSEKGSPREISRPGNTCIGEEKGNTQNR